MLNLCGSFLSNSTNEYNSNMEEN